MIIARGLQGVGLSMFPITFSIVRDQFPREKMAIGQGIITSMFAGGAVIGLSIVDWRFYNTALWVAIHIFHDHTDSDRSFFRSMAFSSCRSNTTARATTARRIRTHTKKS
jgi:MFS family permease